MADDDRASGVKVGLVAGAITLFVMSAREARFLAAEATARVEDLRHETLALAARVAALESTPRLLIQTAPVGDVLLPRGTLERMPDGTLRVVIGR